MGNFNIVKIAYYTGTGGTALAADCFSQSFTKRGCACSTERIAAGAVRGRGHYELLLLLFPVHACNAPEAVYKWIEGLEAVSGGCAAVIAVSGGGEVSPNTACRVSSIKRLRKKGYDVVYEDMLVMPSNWIVAAPPPLALRLLQVLPDKAERIVGDILSGVHKKSSPLPWDRLLSSIGELEKLGARLWGRSIKVGDACTGCGWCAGSCPSGNITMSGGVPRFGGVCHLCLCCVYGCPSKALSPGFGKFVVVKEGYDLRELSRQVPTAGDRDVLRYAKGYLWSGVRKYLSEG